MLLLWDRFPPLSPPSLSFDLAVLNLGRSNVVFIKNIYLYIYFFNKNVHAKYIYIYILHSERERKGGVDVIIGTAFLAVGF